MSIHDQISVDLVSAMKAKDAARLSALRLLKSALNNSAIEKKKDKLSDDEARDVIQKQVKQRRESIESFDKAGRVELAEKEKRELQTLTAYLRAQLTEEELRKIIQDVIDKSGAKTKAEAGKVMKDLMPLVKGRADGKRAQEILNQLLA